MKKQPEQMPEDQRFHDNITVEFRCSDLEKSLITTDRRELQELVEQKKR